MTLGGSRMMDDAVPDSDYQYDSNYKSVQGYEHEDGMRIRRKD